jgi:hypothetical protein
MIAFIIAPPHLSVRFHAMSPHAAKTASEPELFSLPLFEF